ncbi:MAG TPA: class II glutamine amidotransferase [Pyrinomonadaceae bacterium]|nr:class II glutamine amidotransferase [Acidobacteriota bacterium]HMM78847.1 class II glutamine amidotransferase [Pyrinomonadaceae bacterium]
MCRFLGYTGSEILLADLISRPPNSLIRQSYKAKERSEPLNGDGFGVGWYSPEISDEPGVFTSITPAWNNRNLLNLAGHIKSPCFFAHIRAASPGTAVSEFNCHPFCRGRYLWMHNGTIEGFSSIKRRLRHSLTDEIYQSIEGTTDSEHAFAVFLNFLGRHTGKLEAVDLASGLVKTIRQLEEWAHEAGIKKPSIYNFAVTDGESLVTVRYVSNPQIEPISLYYSTRGKYRYFGGRFEIVESDSEQSGIIIASERLTDDRTSWTRVAPNHVVIVNSKLDVTVQLLPNIRGS